MLNIFSNNWIKWTYIIFALNQRGVIWINIATSILNSIQESKNFQHKTSFLKASDDSTFTNYPNLSINLTIVSETNISPLSANCSGLLLKTYLKVSVKPLYLLLTLICLQSFLPSTVLWIQQICFFPSIFHDTDCELEISFTVTQIQKSLEKIATK